LVFVAGGPAAIRNLGDLRRQRGCNRLFGVLSLLGTGGSQMTSPTR
jgi:hypothetical protein